MRSWLAEEEPWTKSSEAGGVAVGGGGGTEQGGSTGGCAQVEAKAASSSELGWRRCYRASGDGGGASGQAGDGAGTTQI